MFTKRKSKNFFLKHKSQAQRPQIFDLLQLSKKERECRAICLFAIRQYEAWKKTIGTEGGSSLKLYCIIEGIFLRRRAEDAVLFYRMIRKDRMQSFQDYMEKLPPRSNMLRVAS